MSEVIQGVIDSIYTKDITIKTGKRAGSTTQVYHAMINGHDVNLGFETKLSTGENVTLNVEHKYGGYQLVQQQSGATKGNTTGPVAGASETAFTPVAPKKQDFPVAIESTGTSICRQSSLNRAVETVETMIGAKVFTPSHADSVVEKTLELAYLYTDFVTGQREAKEAAARAAYNEEE